VFCYDSVGDYSSGARFEVNASSVSNINKNDETVNVYPNPFNDNVVIKSNNNDEIISIRIYDVSGRLIDEVIPQKRETQVIWNGSSLEKGIYTLLIKTGKSATSKMIIRQ